MSSIQTKAIENAAGNGITEHVRAGMKSCPICGDDRVSQFLRAPDRFHLRPALYTLMRCSSCSSVWQADPPRPDEMGIHYDEDYHRAITAAGEGSPLKRWKNQREVVIGRGQGGAILDIGCSSGGFLGTLKNTSWKLYGIEMEPSTAARARENTGAEVFVGDALDAPFAPESFDVVTTFDVLEHVYQPREFLMKIRGWLKPGGIYYTRLPNIDSWEARMLGSYWYGLEMPRHLFHFSPKTISTIMTSLDFETVNIVTSESYLEPSMRYLYKSAQEKLGGSPTPPAKGKEPGIPFRIVRKALRLSVVAPFGWMASAAGSGASMEAIFMKPLR